MTLYHLKFFSARAAARFVFVTLISLASFVSVAFAEPDKELRDTLQQSCSIIDGPTALSKDLRFDAVTSHAALCSLYKERDWSPLWLESPARLHDALHLIQRSSLHGINPEQYSLQELIAKHDSHALSDRLTLELTLTRAMSQLLVDAAVGCRATRRREDPLGEAALNREEIGSNLLKKAVSEANLRRFVEATYPLSDPYRQLLEALAAMRRSRELPPIVVPRSVRRDETLPSLPAFREQLQQLGFPVAIPAENPTTLNSSDQSALRAFQESRGLEADGILGARTVAELNRTSKSLESTIRVNLERLRWRPHPPLSAELPLVVDVNIPDYRLTLFEEGKPTLSMAVIVGKPKTPTALFSANIVGVTFNPWWRVPTSIVRNELLSELRKNPDRATKHGMEVLWREESGLLPIDAASFDWQAVPSVAAHRIAMRQRPGPHNPLGQLKFEMPNPHTIYLHDTPSKNLFSKTVRTFSHGCIRLADPASLAIALLGTPEKRWNGEQLAKAIASEKTYTERIRPPVPVRTSYRTAWVNGANQLILRPDIYKLDEALQRELPLR
jgi:murein L,D-transpeptidase YcbB/YkuD